MAHIKAGKVRALAVTSTRRWPTAPDIPTMVEAGVPGCEVNAWFGLLAPAGMPRPIVEQVQRQVAEILKQPGMQNQLLDLGAAPSRTPPRRSARCSRASCSAGRRSSSRRA